LINKEHLLTHEDRVREEKNYCREVLVQENYEPVSPKPSEIVREIQPMPLRIQRNFSDLVGDGMRQ